MLYFPHVVNQIQKIWKISMELENMKINLSYILGRKAKVVPLWQAQRLWCHWAEKKYRWRHLLTVPGIFLNYNKCTVYIVHTCILIMLRIVSWEKYLICIKRNRQISYAHIIKGKTVFLGGLWNCFVYNLLSPIQ